MAYHSRDGLYFERDNYGNVTVRTMDRPAHKKVLFEVTLPPSEWASAVASMSKAGETGESFRAALDYHQADGHESS